MSLAAKTMMGYSLMGGQTIQDRLNIISNQFDLELKCAIYHTVFRQVVDKIEDLENPEVLSGLNKLKDAVRAAINSVIDELETNSLEGLRAQLKESNKPHELGTVAEIAARYGISKSEVRRRKANGTLLELSEAGKTQ